MNGVAYFIIVVNALLVFKLWWDNNAKNKQKRIINHGKSVAFDGLLYAISAYLLIHRLDGHSLVEAFGATLIAASWRWTAFDAIFAKMNWGAWEFYGKSSILDRFMDRLDGGFELSDNLIKLVPAGVGIALILIY